MKIKISKVKNESANSRIKRGKVDAGKEGMLELEQYFKLYGLPPLSRKILDDVSTDSQFGTIDASTVVSMWKHHKKFGDQYYPKDDITDIELKAAEAGEQWAKDEIERKKSRLDRDAAYKRRKKQAQAQARAQKDREEKERIAGILRGTGRKPFKRVTGGKDSEPDFPKATKYTPPEPTAEMEPTAPSKKKKKKKDYSDVEDLFATEQIKSMIKQVLDETRGRRNKGLPLSDPRSALPDPTPPEKEKSYPVRTKGPTKGRAGRKPDDYDKGGPVGSAWKLKKEQEQSTNIKQSQDGGAKNVQQLLLFFKELYTDGEEVFKEFEAAEVKVLQNFLQLLIKTAGTGDLHRGETFGILQQAAKRMAKNMQNNSQNQGETQ